jgi:hypothetical protein
MTGGAEFSLPPERGGNRVARAFALILLIATALQSQVSPFTAAHLPRFEDFPVSETWNQSPASIKLRTSSERMFRTNLTNASKEPSNFAGHYRVTYWGCGSVCSAGAVVDLQSGEVFQPANAKPNGRGWERWIECAGCFEGTNEEFHQDSRLNYSQRLQKNIPDSYYLYGSRITSGNCFSCQGKQAGK